MRRQEISRSRPPGRRSCGEADFTHIDGDDSYDFPDHRVDLLLYYHSSYMVVDAASREVG